MKRKKIVCLGLSFIGMIITTILSIYITHHASPDRKTISSVNPVNMEEEENLNPALTEGSTTGEESQWEMEDYLFRVYLSNPEELYNSSLPSHGYGTFEEYFSRYIDYYLPGDEHYEVQFIKGSDSSYSACTDFFVKIPDLDITVRCIYVHSLQRYDFRSSLNGYD